MELSSYLSMAVSAETGLAEAFTQISNKHDRDSEVRDQCKLLASWSRAHVDEIQPFIAKYGEDKSHNQQVQQVRGALFHGTRVGGVGLLADLQDLSLLVNGVLSKWTCINEAAMSLQDKELEDITERFCEESDRQLSWLKTEIKSNAAQALSVPSEIASQVASSLPRKQTPETQQTIAWAPLASGMLMLLIGAIALLAGAIAGMPAGYAWLFPSLGPTAYLQAESPANPAARFYNCIVGHLVGLAAGFLAVFLLSAYNDPVTLVAHQLTAGRAVAAALAVGVTLLVCLLLKASHPPAAATTLLAALGSFKIEDAPAILIGILLVSALGEVARRMRLGQLTLRPQQTEKRLPAPKPKPPG